MKKLNNYDDNNRKLQTKWATTLPWVKGQVSGGGFIHKVQNLFFD
jgi:hypothetical protein